MVDWLDKAYEKMDRRRRTLEAKGYAKGAADGAVEWAFGYARHRVPPESNPSGFLAELDRRLARCEKWARGEVDWVSD